MCICLHKHWLVVTVAHYASPIIDHRRLNRRDWLGSGGKLHQSAQEPKWKRSFYRPYRRVLLLDYDDLDRYSDHSSQDTGGLEERGEKGGVERHEYVAMLSSLGTWYVNISD